MKISIQFRKEQNAMSTETRESWSGKLGFVLAAAGSAIGLGNIWKFPYITGMNGGGAFVLVYLGCILLFGLPLMLCEITIGRKTGKNPYGAFKSLQLKRSRTADVIGVLLMLLLTFAQDWLWQPGSQASQNALWHFFNDRLSALLWNPFANAFSALWALLAVGVSGVSIYWLNRKLVYRHTPLEPGQAKRVSLLMAALTAPWLFLLPASWLY